MSVCAARVSTVSFERTFCSSFQFFSVFILCALLKTEEEVTEGEREEGRDREGACRALLLH